MFYYKTSFSGKTAKNPFVGGHDRLKGRGGVWRQKSTQPFFAGIEVLNIFNLTIFLKKTIFSEITAKNYFWKARPFFREWGVGGQKWKQPFLWEMRNWIRWSFFLKKAHTGEWKPNTSFRGHIFLWFYGADCFRKQWGSPMGRPLPTEWISWKSVQNWDLYRAFLYIIIGTLVPASQESPRYLQLYFLGITEEEVKILQSNYHVLLDSEIMQCLQQIMHNTNVYVQLFKCL